MIFWRSGIAGFKNNAKRIIKGVFQYRYTVTTADAVSVASKTIGFNSLISDTLGLSSNMDPTKGLSSEGDETKGFSSIISPTKGGDSE